MLRGCLQSDGRRLYLGTVGQNGLYALTGNTARLQKYIDREISARGSVRPSDEPSMSSFNVAGLEEVFPRPRVVFSGWFKNTSAWHHESDLKYGIEYSEPAEWKPVSGSDWNMARANFVANDGAVTVASFAIPRELFPGSNFVGGNFGIFVNPRLTNRQSCDQFSDSGSRFRSSRNVGGIEYSAFIFGGAAAGTFYNSRDFHAFQNGLCFQVSFGFAQWNTGNSPTGCSIPSLKPADELKVVDAVLQAISFARPASPPPVAAGSQRKPRVVEFKADGNVASTVTNRGILTFSWRTENTDYVQLSYHCVPAPTKGVGVTISEDNVQRECENARMHFNDSQPTHSPDSYARVLFGNFLQPEPMAITVSIVPFSHATAFPEAAKHVAVSVEAINPFPAGLPTPQGSIALEYSPQRAAYQPGTAVTINWKEAVPLHAPCVNLYLAEEEGSGRRTYRLHLADDCLQPARSGAYKWIVPDMGAGREYRIFAMTPGSVASGMGPPFTIGPGAK